MIENEARRWGRCGAARVVIRRAVGHSFVNDLDPEITTDYILSALEQAGYVVVPVVPSEKMLRAGTSGYSCDPGATEDGALEAARWNWESMIAAARPASE